MSGDGSERYLSRVYSARSREELRAIYDDWAERYEADLTGWGYIGPALMMGLLNRHVRPGDGAILDAGCGPGNLGRLLNLLGFEDLVGIDISEGMLAQARGRGVYADCQQMALGEPLAFPDDRFAVALAAGVFTGGQVGPEAFDELIRVTRPGGRLVFSLSEAGFEEDGFKQRLHALEDGGSIAFLDAGVWAPVYTDFPGGEPPRGRVFVYEVRCSGVR